MVELRCPRELAVRLGAIVPLDLDAQRELKSAANLLVRDPVTAEPVFWPWLIVPVTTRSS